MKLKCVVRGVRVSWFKKGSDREIQDGFMRRRAQVRSSEGRGSGEVDERGERIWATIERWLMDF